MDFDSIPLDLPGLHGTIRHGDQRHGEEAGAQGSGSDPKWKIVQLRIAAKAEENLVATTCDMEKLCMYEKGSGKSDDIQIQH